MTTFLKPADIAKALGVKLGKVHAWIRSGELPAVNTATRPDGRPRWRISPVDWEIFCSRRTSRPAVKPVTRRRDPANVIQFF